MTPRGHAPKRLNYRSPTGFEHKPGDTYVVTGQLAAPPHERFRLVFDNPAQALSINLWRGSVFQIRDGFRKVIKRVWN